MRVITSIYMIVWISAISGCDAPRSPSVQVAAKVDQRLIAMIQNSDVKWDGTFLGLNPTLTGVSKELLISTNKDTVISLIAALSDSRRYVAAHVLLSELTGDVEQIGPDCWNGLHVSILPDGSVCIADSEQSFLMSKWKRWYAEKNDGGDSGSNFKGVSPKM